MRAPLSIPFSRPGTQLDPFSMLMTLMPGNRPKRLCSTRAARVSEIGRSTTQVYCWKAEYFMSGAFGSSLQCTEKSWANPELPTW